MTTAVIVQARMGSSRLPAKVMQPLEGRPVLAHVLTRCSRISNADVVVCAIPDELASDPIEYVARQCGAEVFRGSETDVLKRYVGAAKSVAADVVMRVTSDCPLIDPEICDAVLALREQSGADYAANNMPPSFPHGLDCEAMRMVSLLEAEKTTVDLYDREHVTPWLRREPHLRRCNYQSDTPSLAAHRWTLDHPEDLTFFRQVFAALPKDRVSRTFEVLALLDKQPSLRHINSMHARAVIETSGVTQ